MDQEDLTFDESALLCKFIALDNAPKGCIISNDTLAKDMKTSVSSIKRMLKSLKDKDYIIPIYTKKHGFVEDRKIEFTLKTKLLLGVTTVIPQPKYVVRNQPQQAQQKPQKPQQNKPVSYDMEALVEKMKNEVDEKEPSSLNANRKYGFDDDEKYEEYRRKTIEKMNF